MLTAKELMHLEDFLTMEQTNIKALSQLAGMNQDSQTKQLLQDLAQKNQQHFQTISRHLSSSQNLQ